MIIKNFLTLRSPERVTKQEVYPQIGLSIFRTCYKRTLLTFFDVKIKTICWPPLEVNGLIFGDFSDFVKIKNVCIGF